MRKKLRLIDSFIFILLIFSFLFIVSTLHIQKSTKLHQVVVQRDNSAGRKNNSKIKVVDLGKPIVDLSGWQRPDEINYGIVSQHIVGAIIRVNGDYNHIDNSSKKNGEDVAYKTHIKLFQEQGIPVAVYAFVSGRTKKEMRKQAKDFYDRASPYRPTYYWLDVETTNMKNMNEGIEAFRAELANLGAKNIGIYAQDWFIKLHKIDISKFSAVWMSAYGLNTGYWSASPQTNYHYEIHQFTDRGTLPGISCYVDLSIISSEKDYEKLFS